MTEARKEEMKEVSDKIKTILEEGGFALETFINYSRQGIFPGVALADTREDESSNESGPAPEDGASEDTDKSTES